MKRKYFLAIVPLIGGLATAAAVAHAETENKGDMRAGHFFEKFDANDDGKVSAEEFDQTRMFNFEDIDTDQSGGVSMEEMTAHREKMRAQRQKKHFDKVDSDGNGEISKAEFDAKRTSMFERMDKNDDGMIEKSEMPKGGKGMGMHHHSGPFGPDSDAE